MMDSLIVGSNRKIDPSRKSHLLADGTPNENDRIEIGPTKLAYDEWAAAGLTVPDMPALREYRLARLQQKIIEHDCAGLLLFDPLNIRYATDTSNMQLWIAHNAARACFVPPQARSFCLIFIPVSICHLICHLSARCAAGHHFSILRQATGQMPTQMPLQMKLSG